MVMASTVQASPYPPGPSSPPTTAATTSSSSSNLDDTANNNNVNDSPSLSSSPTTAISGFLTSPSFDPRRLQSASTHEALLRLHDNEIVLLESVKKFASLKSNCDKEYARKVGYTESCGCVHLKFFNSDRLPLYYLGYRYRTLPISSPSWRLGLMEAVIAILIVFDVSE